MKLKSLFALASLSLAGFFLNGCGSSGGGSTSLLSAIPKATGPVVSSRALNTFPLKLSASLAPLLDSKFPSALHFDSRDFSMKASAWKSNAWAGKSGPLCEAGQQVNSIFKDAAQADQILCFVTAMDAAGNLRGSNFDNTWKYYEVTGVPGGSSIKVKFKVQLEAGVVKDFKMYTVQPTRSTGRPACANTEYIHADLSSSPAKVTTVYNGSFSDVVNNFAGTYRGRTQAEGTVDSSGNWLTKTIISNNSGLYGSIGNPPTSQNAMYSELNQYPTYLTLKGSMSWASGTYSSKNRLYTKMNIADASSFVNLTYGAGSTNMTSNWDNQGDTNRTRGWNADGTVQPFASSLYDDDVTNPSNLPALKDYTTVSEAAILTDDADETKTECWDGQADSAGFSTAVFGGAAQAGIDACFAAYGEDSSNWVDCYSASGSYTE